LSIHIPDFHLNNFDFDFNTMNGIKKARFAFSKTARNLTG